MSQSVLSRIHSFNRSITERTDGGDPSFPSTGSEWSRKMFMCATVARSKLATVTFIYNGSGGLSSLIIEKSFRNSTSDRKRPPLWAVEDTNMTVLHLNPLWGVVHDNYENQTGIKTV